MALALVLRNSTKFNGAGLFKSVRITPLKSFTTGSNAARTLTLAKPVQLTMKDVSPLLKRNISVTAPRMSMVHHSSIWGAERIVSVALLATIPLAFLVQSQALDALMAVSVVVHTHWGMEALVIDYVKGGMARVAHISLLLISIATLGGMFYLIYNDVGVANAVKKFWGVKGYVEPLDPKEQKRREKLEKAAAAAKEAEKKK